MPFRTQKTDLGLYLIYSDAYPDERGSFAELYKKSALNFPEFVQDNASVSKRGVIRGMHYQLEPSAQGKLVRVIRGKIYDVVVDVRRGSATLGKWEGYYLYSFPLPTSEEHADPKPERPDAVYVPPGFAHGFLSLADDTVVLYKVTAEYDKGRERGIRYDDPEVGIRWPLKEVIVSEKDRSWPLLKDAELMGPRGDRLEADRDRGPGLHRFELHPLLAFKVSQGLDHQRGPADLRCGSRKPIGGEGRLLIREGRHQRRRADGEAGERR
jgi:dTDP-4-dehydrorhamnose 3,5-epimerase